jgi:hypothetical protein
MQTNQQRVMHQGRHSAPQVARMPACSRLAPSGTSAPAAIRDVSARGLGSPEYDPARSFSSEDAMPFKQAEKQPLGLQFQSSRSASSMRNVVKTTGLHRAPLSGGVKTATLRCARGEGRHQVHAWRRDLCVSTAHAHPDLHAAVTGAHPAPSSPHSFPGTTCRSLPWRCETWSSSHGLATSAP